MTSIGLHSRRVFIWLALFSTCTVALADDTASGCSSPQTVLQRYIDAVGGKAAAEMQSLILTAKESNQGFGTEHYVYKFKWKAPNKVVAGDTPYLMGILPVSYPNGNFIFDGEGWSNNDGRKSRNEEREPQWQRELKHKYPYNEDPFFLELRVVADPLLMTRANELYSSLEADTESSGHPGTCVLRANGIDGLGQKRRDFLYFDATTGLLKTWQLGIQQKTYTFTFDDYRKVDAVIFPFYVHFDFYDATFRYTKVLHDKPVDDSAFVEKPEKP